MIDQLALKRWQRASTSEEVGVPEALTGCLADIEPKSFTSVAIIAVDADGRSHLYMAGPQCVTFRQVWLLLQDATLTVFRQIIAGEE